MEQKSERIELRIEPTINRRMRDYCRKAGLKVNKFVGDLIIRDLRSKGNLSPDDIRQMREGS